MTITASIPQPDGLSLAPTGGALERFAYRATLLLTFCIPWGDTFQLLGEVQFSRLFTLPALILTLAMFSRHGAKRPPHAQMLMFLFVLWAGMSLFATIDHYRSLRRLLSYCQLFATMFVLFQSVRTGRQFHHMLQAYVAGCGVALASLGYGFLNGQVMGDGRYTARGFDPNDLAATVTLGIPIAWYLAQSQWRWWNRLYIPCAAVGTLLTASRMGLIMLVTAMAFPLIGTARVSLRSKVSIAVLLAGSGLAISAFQEEISIHRLSTIGSQLKSRDLNGRVQAWDRGFDVFLQHPVGGVGGGAFSSAISFTGSTSAAHNTFLEVLVEHGAFGLVVFVGIILSLLRYILRFPTAEMRLFLTLLAMWGIATMVLSWENREVTWMLWGLAMTPIGARTIVRRRKIVHPTPYYTRWRAPETAT